mgnify:CR=1 FL=1
MVPAHVMLFSVSPVVWITVIIILVVVFGASKLPEIARNVGKSAKVLKEELNDLTEDTKADGKAIESKNDAANDSSKTDPASGNDAAK